ncbi:MAG: NACHT domain-containing protein [Actinobacteria bacterium]|nr:NACHT domain-containing protein [Actinomycetota bacterium]
MSRIDFPKIYNPATQTTEELIENFVVRTAVFQEIFDDVRKSPMQFPEQHYIIQGTRGQGKTTLLLRIAYEIEKDKKLQQRIIPVIFNEEQYNISRLYKLWETIAEYLQEDGEIIGLYDTMQKYADDADYEQRCFQLLEDALKKHKKKLILFIDNIDEMLTKFSKKEHHRLREVFMESAELRIIGASSVSLEFHYDYGQPFYQFFKIQTLRGLTNAETNTLLLKLGERYKRERVKEIVENQPGRVEALRRITGGVIRTIIILFDIFVDDSNGNAFRDLEKILDNVTPLYKHRMDKLSPQQQEIVDFIALSWDAVSAKEIAVKTKMSSKAVSAQLKQLEKYHIIDKERTDNRNFLYRIAERFFNIWYLMRQGRKWDVKRVQFLVEFLQIWCDEKELQRRANKHLQALRRGQVNAEYALYMTEALIRTPIKREMEYQLTSEARSYLQKSHPELENYLSKPDSEYKQTALQALQERDNEKALHSLENIKIKDGEDIKSPGKLYHTGFQDFKKAEKYYLMAAKKNNAGAMNSLAWLYFNQKVNREKAIEYAERSYEMDKDVYSAHTYSMVLLWNNDVQKAYQIAQEFLNDKDAMEKIPEDINLFFLLLLAKKQYHLTFKIFNENPFALKDRFKPVYYAFMYFLQDEYPNEFRKMGGELKQTVEEIISKVRQLEKDYE